MNKLLVTFTLAGALATHFAETALAQCPGTPSGTLRGRPRVADGTVLSDQNGLLRGVQVAMDRAGACPSETDVSCVQPWLATLPGLGLNALHLYAERPFSGRPAGANAALVDQVVSWATANKLYVVLTVGDSSFRNQTERDQITSFTRKFWGGDTATGWQGYVCRYKNHPHVIFEIKNELVGPGFGSGAPGSNSYEVLQLQADIYNLVRTQAPSTPVLFFSYTYFNNCPSASSCGPLQDVSNLQNRIGAPIDWTKAAVAFHGYAGAATTETTVNIVRGGGVPVIETELWCPPPASDNNCPGESVYTPTIEAHEVTGTSWLSFHPLKKTAESSHEFVNAIENAELLWAAESPHTWPGAVTRPASGAVLSLKWPFNNQFVKVNTTGRLVANSATAASNTRFTVFHGPTGFVGLKSFANSSTGLFVIRRSNNNLFAESTSRVDFEWIERPDGLVALRAKSNRRFVRPDTVESATAPPLKATQRKGGGAQEGFLKQ